MIILLPYYFCAIFNCAYGMEHFEDLYEGVYAEEVHNPLEFFGELSQLTISDELKKKRDPHGNTLLHALVEFSSPDEKHMQSLIVEHQFSVREKNALKEDVWLHAMRYHRNDPHFFHYFDLLYHGPTKIQWQALCGKTIAVFDALDADEKLLFEADQRGFPLVYYAWKHKTLLKQLLERKGLPESDSEMYQKIITLWLFRGQQEAKCGRVDAHKKMLESIKIVFAHSKALLKAHGAEFAPRAAYVGADLLKSIFDTLVLDKHTKELLISAIHSRVAKERKTHLNDYYAELLKQTDTYLAHTYL